MGKNNGNNPGAFVAMIKLVISGVTQVIPAKSTLNIGGSQMTQAQILSQLNGILTEYDDVANAKAAYQQQVAAAKANKTKDHDFLLELKGAVVALLGRQNPQLSQFGYSPAKPRKQTAKVALAAAAKREITRAKRNTMGSVQKQSVKAIATPDVSLSNGAVSITPSASDASTTPLKGNITSGTVAGPASASTANDAASSGNGATGSASGASSSNTGNAVSNTAAPSSTK